MDRTKALLAGEGFGVLCDIDVSKTLREKADIDFRPCRILGACNPAFAHQSLQGEPQLGLLLPCNVVVQVLSGVTTVSAIDARALLSVVGNSDLLELADEVNVRLGRVLDSLQASPDVSDQIVK